MFLFFTLSLSAKEYSEDNKMFIFNSKTYEIISVFDDSLQRTINYVQVKKGNEVKEIRIIFPNNDFDLISFGASVNSQRKFVIIQSRYSFSLLNLYNNKIVGPFSPKFYGVGQDAQSGMISGLKIILDGRAIIGYCVDGGAFMYDFTDFYNGKELTPASFPFATNNRIFIMSNLSSENKFFGLFVCEDSWQVSYNYLFVSKNVEWKDYSYLEKLSELEVEDLIIGEKSVEYRYTIINEFAENEKFQYLVYENYTGKKIILPQKNKKGTIDELKKYLSSL